MADISPTISTTSRDNPEFARVITVAQLSGLREMPFDLGPTPEEAAAIARLMGARGVRKMRFSGRLVPGPGGAWDLDAALGATVTQTCVVSLEPVVTRIDTPVHRRFVPDLAPDRSEVTVAFLENGEDEIDPLGERIDLGRVALEALALGLPAYPRRPGAALDPLIVAPPDAEAPTEADVKPFAALAVLRGKGDGSR